MLKPQRLLARHPLHESSKLRLRALEPRDRARIRPRRAALLAAHGPLITIHTFRRRFAHRAVTVPGRGEQVEQIRSHAITSVSRWERDITRLSPPLTRTPSGITANNPDRSASERTNCQRNWAIYPLQTTCTHRGLVGRVGRVAGVEQLVRGFRVGVRSRDVALERGGEARGDGHDAALAVLAVAHLDRGARRIEIAQL